MAVSVTLYTFAKKINSTKRPEGGTTFECVLKEPCGVVSPRIALAISGSPASYNYAYIPTFLRYYFVSEWTWEDGLWVASLNVDALASWKTQIGAENFYCLRASWAGDNPATQYINDNLYPTNTNITIKDVSLQSPYESSYTEGRYVVSTMSNGSAGVGGMTTYVLTQTQFNELRAFMFGEPTYTGVSDDEMSQALQKLAFNPGDYILNSRWIALSGVPSAGSATVKFGWWDSGVSAALLGGSGTAGVSGTIAIPKHPQASFRGIYLNSSPYSAYTLYAGPFGSVQLDPAVLVNSENILYTITVDAITADATLVLRNDSGVIATLKGTGGVEINLGSIVADVSGAISNPTSSALGIIAGGISSLFSGGDIKEGVLASTSSAVIGKSGGGKAGLDMMWHLVGEFLEVVDENILEFGRPLCRSVAPNTHGNAFYIMGDDHVSLACTDTENAAIVSYLKSGFYYE